MELIIKDPEAERLALELANETGETVDAAVVGALRERLEQAKKNKARAEEIMAIGRHCASLPVLDPGTPDEIMGYDFPKTDIASAAY